MLLVRDSYDWVGNRVSGTHSLRASAAGVDERADGVGVVGVVRRQSSISHINAVVGNQRLEVVGNHLRLSLGHAGSILTLEQGGGGDGDERGGRDGGEGTHLDSCWDWLIWFGWLMD